MRQIKLIIAASALSIVLSFIFNFLEYGWSWDRLERVIYSFILALIASLAIIWPFIRVLLIRFSLLVLIFMFILYLFDRLALAAQTGRVGFAILLIGVISLLPELIKKGSLKNV